MIVRPVRWPDDADGIEAIDSSFTTDRVYRVVRDGLGLAIAELTVDPPVTKRYPLPEVDPGEGAFVAELDGEIVGYAQAESPAWNGRSAVSHLHVSAPHRGRGGSRPRTSTTPRCSSTWPRASASAASTTRSMTRLSTPARAPSSSPASCNRARLSRGSRHTLVPGTVPRTWPECRGA